MQHDIWSFTGDEVPPYHQLFNPLLTALRELGGSGSIQEIDEKVIELLQLGESALAQLHNAEQRNQTEIEYRLAKRPPATVPPRSTFLMEINSPTSSRILASESESKWSSTSRLTRIGSEEFDWERRATPPANHYSQESGHEIYGDH
jgi:hypothetical protein